MQHDYDASGSTIKGFRSDSFYSTSKYVPVFRGDALFETLEIESISVVKIDVEGAELEVLDGLQKTIAKQQPFILCEILPVGDEETQMGRIRRDRTDSVLRTVLSSGYEIFRLLRDGTMEPLKRIATHSDLSLCQYMFVPDARAETVCARLNGRT